MLLLSFNSESATKVSLLDVGQGDAILITLPTKERILVDGGPDYEVDRYLSFEDAFGKCHLRAIVLTHPHYDHIKGLNRILERCKVQQVFYSPSAYDSKENRYWAELISDKQVATPIQGSTMRIGEASFHFIWPKTIGTALDKNINNESLSFILKFKDKEMLFLGDLEKEALASIDYEYLHKLVSGRLDYLKVPHHGGSSSLSSELGKLAPEMCLFSVGEANKYNHPHKAVLDFYRSLGCKIRRTDVEGTIEVYLK